MPEDYGAAEPHIELARKYYNGTIKILSYVPPYEKNTKKNDSYIKDMVQKANDSFRKHVQKKKVVKTTTQGTTIKKKPSTSKKTTQKKRVAGK